MPPMPAELKLLIDNLMAQVQQIQVSNDQIHMFVQGEIEKARQNTISISENIRKEMVERLDSVYDDLKGIHDEIKEIKDVKLVELQKALVKNQNEGYKRIIGAQAAVLLIIVTAVVGIVFQYFHH